MTNQNFDDAVFSTAPTLAEQLLSRSDLKNLPEPEPLIENVLDLGTTAHMYGMWGTAKSFIALDWALCVATGKRWQGREVKRRKVLYIVAEGAQGFKGRVDAWEQGWQTEVDDEWIRFLPIPVNLIREDEVTELCMLIHNGGYDFIIIDTLARCTTGADENGAKDMGLAVESMDRMRRYTTDQRGVILDVHHTGKDEKTSRGSVCIEGGADTVYFVSRDEMVYTLERRKRKDGPQNDVHVLKLDLIEGTKSAVLSAVSGETGVGQGDSERRLLSHFVSLFSETGTTTAQLRDSIEMPKSTFHRALNKLLERGDLVQKGSLQRPFIELPK